MPFSRLEVFLEENEEGLDEEMIRCKRNLYRLWVIVLPQASRKIGEDVYGERVTYVVETVDPER